MTVLKEPSNLDKTNAKLGLHVDLPYYEYAPGVSVYGSCQKILRVSYLQRPYPIDFLGFTTCAQFTSLSAACVMKRRDRNNSLLFLH